VPAAREARIEGESVIDQHDHRIEVFAENGKRHCGVGQNATGQFALGRLTMAPPSKLDPCAARIGVRCWSVEACGQNVGSIAPQAEAGP